MAAGQKVTSRVKRSPENASILLVNEVKLNLSNYREFGSAIRQSGLSGGGETAYRDRCAVRVWMHRRDRNRSLDRQCVIEMREQVAAA